MIGLASFMALACFFVPRRRFTATEAAERWAEEALEVTKVPVRHLPESTDEVLRLKSRGCLEKAEKILEELRRSVSALAFERFAYFWAQQERQNRLELLPKSLERVLERLPLAYQAAEALELRGGLPKELHQALQQCCEAHALKLDGGATAALLAEQADARLNELWRQDQAGEP